MQIKPRHVMEHMAERRVCYSAAQLHCAVHVMSVVRHSQGVEQDMNKHARASQNGQWLLCCLDTGISSHVDGKRQFSRQKAESRRARRSKHAVVLALAHIKIQHNPVIPSDWPIVPPCLCSVTSFLSLRKLLHAGLHKDDYFRSLQGTQSIGSVARSKQTDNPVFTAAATSN